MERIKVRATAIKKGDRFFNEFWGKDVIATSDSYRLDGRDGDGYPEGRKPKVAVMSWDRHTEQWQHCWWMAEVGVNDGGGAMGVWSKPEHEYIEVEREEAA